MQIPVSVILPVYKGAAYLKNAIESILQQSFTSFELVIVNDASPDNSEEIIRQFTDPRIKYFKSDINLGLVGALNKAISLSSGKYLARMDQDDFSFKDRLKIQYEFLENNPEYIVAGTKVRILGTERLKEYPATNEEIKMKLVFGAPFAHPAVMIRKSILDDNDLQYEEQYRHAEDFGLWMRLSALGKMINLDYVGLDYRIHETQYTKVFTDDSRDVYYTIRDEYLKKIGVKMDQQDRDKFEILSRRDIDVRDEKVLRETGDFINKLADIFKNASIDQRILKDFLYVKWKRFCVERAKKGLKTYSIFRSCPVSKWRSDWKLHLWFLKNYLAS